MIWISLSFHNVSIDFLKHFFYGIFQLTAHQIVLAILLDQPHYFLNIDFVWFIQV